MEIALEQQEHEHKVAIAAASSEHSKSVTKLKSLNGITAATDIESMVIYK